MGPDRGKHLRNIAILLLLAVVVWRIQAGRQGADAIANLLTVVFLGGIAFLGFRMYMEHRTTLFDLEEGLRRILYLAVAAAVFAIVATNKMWDAGGASIFLWLALIAFAGFGVFHVITRHREYG